MQNTFNFDADSFDDYSPSQEDALREAMKKQWAKDQQKVKDRGVIPDWIGEPHPLSKDRARLLSLLYEVGCIHWTSGQSQNNRDVTRQIGLHSTGNAKAVIDACKKDGLISSRIYREQMTFELTMQGEFALDEYERDVEMGIL